MIEIVAVKDIKDATPEELDNLRRKGFLPVEETRRMPGRSLSPYERTRAQVVAKGNAIMAPKLLLPVIDDLLQEEAKSVCRR